MLIKYINFVIQSKTKEMAEKRSPINCSQISDTSILYEYINTLEMQNYRRNQERITLQTEVTQLKLQVQLPMKQIHQLKQQNHRIVKQNKAMWIQVQKLQQKVYEHNIKNNDFELQYQSLKHQHQKLKRNYELLFTNHQKLKNNHALTMKTIQQLQKSQDQAFQSRLRSQLQWKRTMISQDQIRNQAMQYYKTIYEEKQEKIMSMAKQQIKSQAAILCLKHQQQIVRHQKELQKQIKNNKNTLAQQQKELNLKEKKIHRLQQMIEQLKMSLQCQINDTDKFRSKLEGEKQLNILLKEKNKFIESQIQRIIQQKQDILLQYENVLKHKHSLKSSSLKHKFSNDDRQLNDLKLSVQQLKSHLDAKQKSIFKSDQLDKLKYYENELIHAKQKILNKERQIIRLKQQLDQRQDEIQQINKRNQSIEQKINSQKFIKYRQEVKKYKELIRQLNDILKRSTIQIADLQTQAEHQLRHIDMLEDSNKRLRQQILFTVSKLDCEKQLKQQIRALKKQNVLMKTSNIFNSRKDIIKSKQQRSKTMNNYLPETDTADKRSLSQKRSGKLENKSITNSMIIGDELQKQIQLKINFNQNIPQNYRCQTDRQLYQKHKAKDSEMTFNPNETQIQSQVLLYYPQNNYTIQRHNFSRFQQRSENGKQNRVFSDLKTRIEKLRKKHCLDTSSFNSSADNITNSKATIKSIQQQIKI